MKITPIKLDKGKLEEVRATLTALYMMAGMEFQIKTPNRDADGKDIIMGLDDMQKALLIACQMIGLAYGVTNEEIADRLDAAYRKAMPIQ